MHTLFLEMHQVKEEGMDYIIWFSLDDWHLPKCYGIILYIV